MSKKNHILTIVRHVLSAVAVIIGAFLLFGVVVIVIFTHGDIPQQSDAVLIAQFQAHRSEFNQLLAMINADKDLERVDDTWTKPASPQAIGVAPERIAAYRKLFSTIGVPRGFAAYQSKQYIQFIASAEGLGISGSSKGYVYTTTAPTNIVQNLDTYRGPRSSYPVYHHIEGNWYLYFETD